MTKQKINKMKRHYLKWKLEANQLNSTQNQVIAKNPL